MTRSALPLLVFGEALVDDFADGPVVGGAPFNVARHLAGLGLSPRVLTRIGRDRYGALIEHDFQAYALPRAGLQIDDHLPTGQVRVHEVAGQGHRFEILRDQAYDAIDASDALKALAGISQSPGLLLYHGTLAARAAPSRAALQACIDACPQARVFVDLNWRDGQIDVATAAGLSARADTLKLNEQELLRVGSWFGVIGDLPMRPPLSGTRLSAVNALMSRIAARQLIVTYGAEGYARFDRDGVCVSAGRASPQSQLVDTVGAGDAFSAITLAGIALDWPLSLTLQRAAEFASAVCGLRGAVPATLDFYTPWRAAWALPPRAATP